MEPSIYNSPAKLKEILNANGLHMQKKFGQNFLINETIRTHLVSRLQLTPQSTVWEVGPGLGSMTDLLLKTGAEVVAFEIDKGFIKILHSYFDHYENFTLVEGDVLRTWKKQLAVKKPDCFFGNLPYNIAATLILDTIENGVVFSEMLITVQKEVADRFCAKVGEDYSAASVLVQAFYDTASVQTIAPSCFFPQPNVVSKAISLKKTTQYTEQLAGNEKLFFSLVKGLFASRRKTLKNNFHAWLKINGYPSEYLDAVFTPELQARRAETLTVQDFVDAANRLAKAVKDR